MPKQVQTPSFTGWDDVSFIKWKMPGFLKGFGGLKARNRKWKFLFLIKTYVQSRRPTEVCEVNFVRPFDPFSISFDHQIAPDLVTMLNITYFHVFDFVFPNLCTRWRLIWRLRAPQTAIGSALIHTASTVYARI